MILDDLKFYANRDPSALEPWYSEHVSRMTGEGLYEKSAIAAELAFRDQGYSKLLREITRLTFRHAPDTEGKPTLEVTDEATFQLEELVNEILGKNNPDRTFLLALIAKKRIRKGHDDTRQLVVALRRAEERLATLEHLLEVERREHEETKGYRQHAEQLLAECRANIG